MSLLFPINIFLFLCIYYMLLLDYYHTNQNATPSFFIEMSEGLNHDLHFPSFWAFLSHPMNRIFLSHNQEVEPCQGVEFTAISCCSGGLGWSMCDGMTRRCNDFSATVSCANEGRRFGSLVRTRWSKGNRLANKTVKQNKF